MATSKRTSPAAVSAILKRAGFSPLPVNRRSTATGAGFLWVEASPIANADALVVLSNTTGVSLVLFKEQLVEVFTQAGLFVDTIATHNDGSRIEFYVARRTPVSATLASGQTAVQIDGQDYLWLVRRSDFSLWAIELDEGADIAAVALADPTGTPFWRIAATAIELSDGHWDVIIDEDDTYMPGLKDENDALAHMLSALDTARPAREERRLTAKLAVQWNAIEDGLVDYSQRWHCALSASENADMTLTQDGMWTDSGKNERTSYWYETALSGFYSNLDEDAYAEYAKEA